MILLTYLSFLFDCQPLSVINFVLLQNGSKQKDAVKQRISVLKTEPTKTFFLCSFCSQFVYVDGIPCFIFLSLPSVLLTVSRMDAQRVQFSLPYDSKSLKPCFEFIMLKVHTRACSDKGGAYFLVDILLNQNTDLSIYLTQLTNRISCLYKSFNYSTVYVTTGL